MASVNKVVLIGNLGADPELRFSATGNAVCNIRLATSESWKDKATGEKREQTEWHRVVLYRKLAEIAGTYLKKGSQVYIEGQIRTRKWQDKTGVERYTTEVEAAEMTMLGLKAESNRQEIVAIDKDGQLDEFLGTKGTKLEPDWLDKIPF